MGSEVYKKRLLELMQLDGNNCCADCRSQDPKPDFISITLGTFVCINCSGIHRMLGVQYSVVKSILLDTMDEEKHKKMKEGGNNHAALIWERKVPPCWPIVTKDSSSDVRAEWIRAKYQRQEFTDDAAPIKRPYTTGTKEGFLWKKKKQNSTWQERYVSVSAKDGYLSIYVIKKEEISKDVNVQNLGKPKHCISIVKLNVMRSTKETTGKEHTLLLTFPENNGQLRHIYFSHHEGFVIVDWYLVIRAARYKMLEKHLKYLERPIVNQILSRCYIKCGHLWKTGSKKSDGWKRRFVCIDIHRFLYFDKAMDSKPIQEVSVDNSRNNCLVLDDFQGEHAEPPTSFVFIVKGVQNTQTNRNPIYKFCAESESELKEWTTAFRKAMNPINWLKKITDKTQKAALLSNISWS